MHRFFAADAAERETILLDENESKHARSVLRVRDGEARKEALREMEEVLSTMSDDEIELMVGRRHMYSL